MAGCKVGLTLTGLVPGAKAFSRCVKALERSGCRVLSLNEDLRRVVCTLSPADIGMVGRAVEECAESYHLTLKVECRPVEAKGLAAGLKKLGLRLFKGPGGITARGVIGGRIVEVNLKGDLMVVKVGRRTKSGRLLSPVPPSAFNLSLEESLEAISHINKLARLILGCL